jgi:glyoxylase-like metal-dependent hydrolase (beta-lactamase superfamily II)
MNSTNVQPVYPTEISGLHRIPLPTPFPIGAVNTYLVEADEDNPLTLIDCGVNNDETYAALASGLATLGHKISDIGRLILTHHHTDHVGLARRIVDESGAEVWSHPLTVSWLEHPADKRQELTEFTRPIFMEGGVSDSALESIEMVSMYLELLSCQVNVTKQIDEGDTIGLSGSQWRVYHTPGHAGDLICFYQPETRMLIASDHLLKSVSSNPLIEAPDAPDLPRPQRLLDYMRETQRIAALPIDMAYTGHGEPFSNIREVVESRIAFHHKRADKIMELFDGQPRTLYELTMQLFPTLHESQLYLGLSEVLGHLDLLIRDGRIQYTRRDNHVYWSVVEEHTVT